MRTTIATYPVFDANQVLTKDHLNAVVDYLDEQERLSRANLVGVGISCGLALTLGRALGKAGFTRGCAVTSLGYLVVEQEDVALTGYREYTLPEGDAYAPFMDGERQLPIWELFPDGEPNVTHLDSPADFLSDKSVLLFVERNNENLSDCSPSNCDDKGSEVTITVRRLLVNTSDVDQISAALADVGSAEAARLDLPELRLRRYDTPGTDPVTTRDVLEAFQVAVKKDSLVTKLGEALDAAYLAFKPILEADYPTNPFNGFESRYGFLETTPVETRQVTFMQYYMDLIADLIAAYDEFRQKGLELLCLCCPFENWFPRHVVLGPERRTGWHPASASRCGCETLRSAVALLFERLVEMTLRFTHEPALPQQPANSTIDEQIRVTPSRAGDVALSGRCIPYYFEFTGATRMHELWNPALTARKRAHHNLAYRYHEYSPPTPAFVSAALSFDLEPFDFFRIEGHVGKHYLRALATLLAMRDSYRLPFDVIVLRTGKPDESVEADPSDHECRLQDLEAAYDVLRNELTCLAKKAFASLGQVKEAKSLPRAARAEPRSSTVKATLLLSGTISMMGVPITEVAKHFGFEADSIGAALVDNAANWGIADLPHPTLSTAANVAMAVLSKLVNLTATLAEDLRLVDWDEFETTWKELKTLSQRIGTEAAESGTSDGLSWEELNRQIVSVVYACRIEGFLALRDEYKRRLLEIRKLAWFSNYVEEHPAIQHKAGVPVGGTFILVYHAASKADAPNGQDTYDTAIGQLSDGTVVADFFLPYQCCSNCAPIQYVIAAEGDAPQVEPPAITSRVGCTEAESGADVDIIVSGGTSPYALVVGGEDRGTTNGAARLKLVPGSYTVQATDSDGLSATPITVIVPEALTASPVAYLDDTAAGRYTASFRVAGGVGPYSASEGEMAGDVVTIVGLRSDSGLSVVIRDAARCSTTVEIQHTVEEVCDKPCKGKALRCRYPAWAPRPSKTTRYKYKAFKTWTLQFTDDEGTTILFDDFAPLAMSIIERETEITETNYARLMADVCAQVSAVIDAKLSDKYKPQALVIGYDPKGGTLVIEWYECHAFVSNLEFVLAGEFSTRSEGWIYTPEGTRVRHQRSHEPAKTYRMPMFGRIELDKCAGTQGGECTVAVTIVPTRSENALNLEATFGEDVNVGSLDIYWRVETPALLHFEDTRVVKIATPNVATVQVQLLVIDKKTDCWFFGEATFAPDRDTPIRFTRRHR
jgi:hypothetical protein